MLGTVLRAQATAVNTTENIIYIHFCLIMEMYIKCS